MALSKFTRTRLKLGFADNHVGKEIADVVDAGSGTLSAPTASVIFQNFGNHKAATLFVASVNAGTALTGFTQRHLTNTVGVTAAREVAAALLA